jgi:capsular exopolysaccharide synthesis family protein
LKTEDSDSAENMSAPGSQEHRFQEYLSLFLRGKWIILVCVAILTGFMVWYTFQTAPIYEAFSLVLINTKDSRGSQSLTDALSGGSANKISNELGILKTRSLAESVGRTLLKQPYLDSARKKRAPIAEINQGPLQGTLLTAEQIASRLRDRVAFEREKEADIIRITVRSTSPREAALLADLYARAYQEQITIQSRSRTRSVREFLEQRLGEQRQQLTSAEESMRAFMQSSGVVSLDAESNQIVQQMAQLQASRDALDVDIGSLSKKLASFEAEFPQQETSVAKSISQANDPYIRLLQEQVAKLEVQRDVILAQNDPAVLQQDMYKRKLKEIDDQVASLRQKLQQRSNEFIQSFLPGGKSGAQGDAFGSLRTLKQEMLESKFQLEALRSKRAALEGILADYERRFKLIPRQSIEFARLQRERLSTEKLYSIVEEKFNEAAITEKSEFGYVDIIDTAEVPGNPVSPNMKKNILLGIVMGLVLGIASVVLKDALDIRVRTPEQLRKRGYTSLSEVAPMNGELKLVGKGEGIPEVARRFDKRLWLIFNPISFLGESYRRLRTTLLHLQMEKRVQVMVVTSPDPGDGKTTTACNLAIAFSETQNRILLIDADLRRPTVHTSFGLGREPGLTDILKSRAGFHQAVHRDVVDNLDVLTCGAHVKHPSWLFGSPEMRALLEELRPLYSYVFLDAPPVLVVHDAAVLAGALDGTFLTVSADVTRMASLDRARDFIKGGGGFLLGVVLNRFEPRKAYGGYYGGARYGHYGSNEKYYSSTKGTG